MRPQVLLEKANAQRLDFVTLQTMIRSKLIICLVGIGNDWFQEWKSHKMPEKTGHCIYVNVFELDSKELENLKRLQTRSMT